MTSIKTRRDVLALLTPEQRTKEQAEHEKVDAATQEHGIRKEARDREDPPSGNGAGQSASEQSPWREESSVIRPNGGVQ